MRKTAALLYGNDAGHLDHLAPFCSLFDIPLFFTDETLFHLTLTQYEKVEAYLEPPTTICHTITENFDRLISTLPKGLIDPLFLMERELHKKTLPTFWLPHGASDKKNLTALADEEHLLIYGEKMKEMLPKKVQEKTTLIGNFRQKYFFLHQDFYKKLLTKTFSFSDQKNYLYAPSWEAKDIKQWVESFIQHKPENAHLFIKLHPNTAASIVLQEKYL
nr:hypothetical protein [bacterium]